MHMPHALVALLLWIHHTLLVLRHSLLFFRLSAPWTLLNPSALLRMVTIIRDQEIDPEIVCLVSRRKLEDNNTLSV